MKNNRREHPLDRLGKTGREVTVRVQGYSEPVVVLLMLSCTVSGALIGYNFDKLAYMTGLQDQENTAEQNRYVGIHGFETVFLNDSHPDMSGSTIGYFRPYEQDRIYIETGLQPYNLYTTCVHERLHEKGITEEGEDHDWIRQVEDEIVDRYCINLVAETK